MKSIAISTDFEFLVNLSFMGIKTVKVSEDEICAEFERDIDKYGLIIISSEDEKILKKNIESHRLKKGPPWF